MRDMTKDERKSLQIIAARLLPTGQGLRGGALALVGLFGDLFQ